MTFATRISGQIFSSFTVELGIKHILLSSTALALLVATPATATETQKYRYDAKGRLIKVERIGTVNNGVTTEYTHDKADNRTRVKTTGSPNSPP
jgi:YD repeat-containing protein